MKFDIKKDIEVINGGGFWCRACITGKPAAEQSPDPRYCLSCNAVIQNEKKIDTEQKDKKDRWSADGQTFITGGQGFRLKKDLTQVCIGPVDADGERLKAPTTPPALIGDDDRAVTTIPQVSQGVCQSFETNYKHPGGRPQKSGDDISRTTIWRREKEKELQGALI